MAVCTRTAFEVIYVYSQRDGTLDVNIRGARPAVEPLQGLFAATILKQPALPPDPTGDRVYDLHALRDHKALSIGLRPMQDVARKFETTDFECRFQSLIPCPPRHQVPD